MMLLFVIRYNNINSKYPSPVVIVQNEEGIVRLGSYEVKLLEFSITSFEKLTVDYPSSSYFEQQIETNEEVLLFTISFTNIDGDENPMAIYNTTVSTGYTTNGMDLFAFYDINDCDPVLLLEKNQSVELTLPYTLFNEDISGDLELLFALYPEIIKLII